MLIPDADELDFYPRPHMEGDSGSGRFKSAAPYFYPRPHMEGDHDSTLSSWKRIDFYPRPHMEGDEDDGGHRKD